MEWTYTPTTEKETGYEDMPLRFRMPPEVFNSKSEAEQNQIVTDLVAWIRTKNHFPVYYFNTEGIKKEIMKVYAKKDVHITNGELITQASGGLLLLDYLFPNLHTADAGYYDGVSVYNRFYDDTALSKCLKGYMQRYPINNLRTAFFQLGRLLWNTATNFAPMRARAIYEHLAAPGSTIYDFSCGFGGRMLGCLANPYNYTYIGCEPNTETFRHLNELGQYIDAAIGQPGRYKLYCACSEDLQLEPESVDLAFSCPPFFALERYTNEPTQCYIKFPQYDKWLEGYVKPTIQNIWNALKPQGLMAVDILDFKWRNHEYKLVSDWKRVAAEIGFTLVETIPVRSRSNLRKKGDTNPDKLEAVYVFKKNI